MGKSLVCPNCGNTEFKDNNYEDSVTCIKCKLEFMNYSLWSADPENALSVQEMTAFLDAIIPPENRRYNPTRWERFKIRMAEKFEDRRIGLSISLFISRILGNTPLFVLIMAILLLLPILYFFF